MVPTFLHSILKAVFKSSSLLYFNQRDKNLGHDCHPWLEADMLQTGADSWAQRSCLNSHAAQKGYDDFPRYLGYTESQIGVGTCKASHIGEGSES
eukprot:3362353-Amphidinium_carterae.1